VAKLLTDYGVIGLLTFLMMLIGTLWRRDIALMSLVALTTFLIGGGYLLFTPMLVLSFLLCIWSEEALPARPATLRRIERDAV
jgi:hypothetical protein